MKVVKGLLVSAVVACTHQEYKKQAASTDARMPVTAKYWTQGSDAREVAAEKSEKAKCEKMVKRIKEDCYLSENDHKRLVDNAVKCKQVNAEGVTLEAILLKESGKVLIVKTRDEGAKFGTHLGRPWCPTTKYDVGPEIEDIKIIGGKIFLNSKTTGVYMMRSEGSDYGMNQEVFYEILSSKKKSYDIWDIKGASNGTDITFVNRNGTPQQIVDGQSEIGPAELDRLFDKDRMRRLYFDYYTTGRSLFRDE